jgi:ElaA protein
MRWYRFDALSKAQLYELLAFRQAIFVVEQRSPYRDLDGHDQAAWHLVLRRDGEIVGCLRLLPGPDRVRIGRVAVAAPLRRQGLARRLVEAALRRCREDWPHHPVALSAQAYLVPFYRSFGFAVASAPYDDYGVAHVDMLKEG